MISISIFVLGLVIGSFLNAFIYRMEKEKSVVKGRSFCPHCKHTLSWYDLIPLVSFLLLKGACRYCSKKISFQYPAVELATGLLFLAVLFFQGAGIVGLLFGLFIAAVFVVIFVYDLKHYLIPDIVVYAGIAASLLYLGALSVFTEGIPLIGGVVAAVIASGFFLSLFLVSRGKWMGFGDVKLGFLMGLVVGFPNILVALLIAFIVGAITGVILIYLKRKTMKAEVPFGPFLILGTFIAWFWGTELVNFYLGLLV